MFIVTRWEWTKAKTKKKKKTQQSKIYKNIYDWICVIKIKWDTINLENSSQSQHKKGLTNANPMKIQKIKKIQEQKLHEIVTNFQN